LPESAHLVNISTVVYYQSGLVKEGQNELQDALQMYEKVLTVDSNHVPALIHMGSVYIKLGQLELAESSLRTAVHQSATSHEAWFVFLLFFFFPVVRPPSQL